MGYIGNQTTNAYTCMDKQDITGNGGANYTLSHAVANEQEIEVFVNNVRQEGGVGKAYTVSGTALTMTGNVSSSDEFYVVFQGKAVGTIVPPDGSVGTAKLADASVSTAKIIDGNVTAAKLATTLDLSGKTLTLPSGYVKQVYDSGFISIATDSWITVTHNIALPYTVSVLQKVLTSGAGEDAEYSDNDVIEISPNTEIGSYSSTGFHSISKDNSLRVWGHAAVGGVHNDTTTRATGYLVRQTTNGTRFLIYKAQ